MKYHLYILENLSRRHYIGISADMTSRLKYHNGGKVKSTKAYRPWRIVYTEEFKDRALARRREVLLKTNFTQRNKILEDLKK